MIVATLVIFLGLLVDERKREADLTSNRSDAPEPFSSSLVAKLLVLACVVGAGVLGYWFVGGSLTLSELAQRELQLRQFQDRQPVLVYAVAFLIYVIVTGASLPGATALSLAYGWYFSFWRAFILVSFSSTAGATVAFLLSRYLFRDAVQRIVKRFVRSVEQIEHDRQLLRHHAVKAGIVGDNR